MEINESKYLYIRPPREVLWAMVVFLAVLILFFGAKLVGEVGGYNRPIPAATITVSGEGKVLVKPDVAVINIGVLKQHADLVSAQRSAASVMSAVADMLKRESVAEKDIKTTAYSISPRHDYKDGVQAFRGYEVHQNLEVKIRDLAKVGTILSKSAELGANQVGSIQFVIDDPKVAKDEARALAVAEAKEKAAKLARELDVRLKKIVGYSESGADFPPPIYAKVAFESGFGGPVAPPTPEGENEVRVVVNVTYEIK